MHWHSNLRKAKRTFRKVIDQANRHRHEVPAQRHIDCNNSGQQDIALIIKCIIQAEAKRTMFQRFNRYINPPSDSNMNYLEIPTDGGDPKDPHTSWSRIDDIDTMNAHLTTYNKRHFAQAQGTPFTVAPLSDALQHHGITDAGQAILDDKYQPPLLSTQLLVTSSAILLVAVRTTITPRYPTTNSDKSFNTGPNQRAHHLLDATLDI